MAVFVALSRINKERLAKAVQAEFPDDHIRYDDGVWFIKVRGTTTKKIQERLGVAPNVFPGVVIIRVTNSFNGLASSDFWEWLAPAFEPEDG